MTVVRTIDNVNELPKELEIDINEDLIENGYIDYETAFFCDDNTDDIIYAIEDFLVEYFGCFVKYCVLENIDFIMGTIQVKDIEWKE